MNTNQPPQKPGVPQQPQPKPQPPKEPSAFERYYGKWASGKDIESRLRQYVPSSPYSPFRNMTPRQRAAAIMKEFKIDTHGYLSDSQRRQHIERLKNLERGSSGAAQAKAQELREILEKKII